MQFAIFSMDGLFFLLRGLHILLGIVWIGHLYYFNFVQGPFFAETDAATKSNAIQKLVPRALLWFRWSAMYTLITGVIMLGLIDAQNGHAIWHLSNGVLILIGALMAFVMWFNVWFVIWPSQKVVIASATNVAQGKAADPTAAARGARSMVASRTNVLFSIPMVFFMAAGKHLSLNVNPEASLTAMWAAILVIVLGLQANALKGKAGPMTTVRGVIHCGLVLTIVLYLIVEFLSK